jgi:hypothetical protein
LAYGKILAWLAELLRWYLQAWSYFLGVSLTVESPLAQEQVYAVPLCKRLLL